MSSKVNLVTNRSEIDLLSRDSGLDLLEVDPQVGPRGFYQRGVPAGANPVPDLTRSVNIKLNAHRPLAERFIKKRRS